MLIPSDHHPTVGELHREVRRSFPRTSLATIYNTIELLKEAGQVLEIEFSGAPNRYDGRRPNPHPHLDLQIPYLPLSTVLLSGSGSQQALIRPPR